MLKPFLKEESRRYVGINIGVGNISVSIDMARKLKEWGWQRAIIYYDNEEGIVKLERTEDITKGHAVQWQHISASLSRVMPEGRYAFDENCLYNRQEDRKIEDPRYLTFKKIITTQ